jgi:hypothetical protein
MSEPLPLPLLPRHGAAIGNQALRDLQASAEQRIAPL